MLSPQTQGGSDLTQVEGDLRSTECGRQGVRTGGARKAFLHMCTAQSEKGACLRGSRGSTGPSQSPNDIRYVIKTGAVSSEAGYRQTTRIEQTSCHCREKNDVTL